MFEVSFSQSSRLNSFFLLIYVFLSLVQGEICAELFCWFVFMLVFPLMGKAEWDDNPVCWWLGLCFCFVYCLDEVSCTGCYWCLDDAGSCIQVVSFVWVLNIWYLGSRVLESVLPLQRLRAWSLPKMSSNTVLVSGSAVGAAQILIWPYSCVFLLQMPIVIRTSVGALNILLYIL